MEEVLIFSLVIGLFVGFSAGYLGSIMVLEKMSLVGDALSHVALPGLALGFMFNFNPFIGGFIFLFGSAAAVWWIGRLTKLPFETIVGALFTLALSVGILIFPKSELLEALFGDITQVTLVDSIVAALVSVVAIVLMRMIYDKVVLTMISEELAVSHGIDVQRTNLLYLLLVSLTVAVGIKIVGTLLVGFLVVVPAAAAKTVSSNLRLYTRLSSIIGAISSASGIMLSSIIGLPAGPLVVLSGIAVFLVVIAYSKMR